MNLVAEYKSSENEESVLNREQKRKTERRNKTKGTKQNKYLEVKRSKFQSGGGSALKRCTSKSTRKKGNSLGRFPNLILNAYSASK